MIYQHRKLLQAMMAQKDRFITSRELGGILGISSRTVKNYVTDINASCGREIIVSSSRGYRILAEQVRLLLANDSSHPDSYMERAYYIIKKLLIEHESLNLFDLCDQLFISYSTLKADIRKYNVTFQKFDILFVSRDSNLIIQGTENAKRRLISYVILQESNKAYIDISRLKECFPPETVDQTSALIREIQDRYQLYINDYSFMVLLQHLLIAVERTRADKRIDCLRDTGLSKQERDMRNEIAEMVEERFCVRLDENEKTNIFTLILTNAHTEALLSETETSAHLRPDILALIRSLAVQVKDVYSIDLSADTFVLPFCAHLQSFLGRINTGHHLHNPIHEHIRRECPLIYDIAIFMALQVQKSFDIPLIEDEISFFALHIGSEMVRQNSFREKIKCTLFCPDYLDQQKNYVKQLMFYYGNEIEITSVVSQTSDLNGSDAELILSTVPLALEERPFFLLPPLLFDLDQWTLSNAIKEIKQRHKWQAFAQNVEELFSKNLFLPDSGTETKQAAIQLLCSAMEENNYVDEDFWEQVLKREAIAPTSFGALALPHSLKMNAVKSGIGVLVSVKGIVWDDTVVHLVFLPAISEPDKNLFSDFYTVLMELFVREDLAARVKFLNSFDKFLSFVLEKIQEKS